jgi:hypothetical protein
MTLCQLALIIKMATNQLQASLRSASYIRKLRNGSYWPGTGILLLGMLLLWSSCTTPSLCSEAERNVLVEFPLYGGGEVDAEGNVDTGACAVFYEVPDSPDQVQSSSGLHFLLYIKEMAQMKYKFLL